MEEFKVGDTRLLIHLEEITGIFVPALPDLSRQRLHVEGGNVQPAILITRGGSFEIPRSMGEQIEQRLKLSHETGH